MTMTVKSNTLRNSNRDFSLLRKHLLVLSLMVSAGNSFMTPTTTRLSVQKALPNAAAPPSSLLRDNNYNSCLNHERSPTMTCLFGFRDGLKKVFRGGNNKSSQTRLSCPSCGHTILTNGQQDCQHHDVEDPAVILRLPEKPILPNTDDDTMENNNNNKSAIQAPLRMGTDMSTGEVDVIKSMDRRKTTQELLNRVKSGQLTPEEKEAFFKAAIMSGNTLDSRLPVIFSDMDGSRDHNGDGKHDKADDEESRRKREFLNSIINPGRYAKHAKATADLGKAVPSITMTGQNLTSCNNNTYDDLGSRLGAAAFAEQQQKQALKQSATQSESVDSKIQAEKENLIIKSEEMDRVLQKEMDKILAETEAGEKFDEEAKLRELEEKLTRLADERWDEVIKSQKEYWASKVKDHLVARASIVDGKSKVGDSVTNGVKEKIRTISKGKNITEDRFVAPVSLPAVFNPDESELLQKAKEVLEMVENEAKRTRNNPLVSDGRCYLGDQERDQLDDKTKSKSSVQKNSGSSNNWRKILDSAKKSGPMASQGSSASSKRILKVKSHSFGGVFNGAKKSEKKETHAVDREMTITRMKLKDTDQETASSATALTTNDNSSESIAHKKKPIRMRIPLEDYTDYAEDGVDANKNKGINVQDALKKINSNTNPENRSKQWGIDMSRFKDEDETN